ncbi:MAG: hypothetical protein ACRDFX_02325 [Chloroflexota bacterium]
MHTVFDCKHETTIEVDVDQDVEIPASVRGLGKCPQCQGEAHLIAVSGVAPQIGGKRVVLDSIMMMPI